MICYNLWDQGVECGGFNKKGSYSSLNASHQGWQCWKELGDVACWRTCATEGHRIWGSKAHATTCLPLCRGSGCSSDVLLQHYACSLASHQGDNELHFWNCKQVAWVMVCLYSNRTVTKTPGYCTCWFCMSAWHELELPEKGASDEEMPPWDSAVRHLLI